VLTFQVESFELAIPELRGIFPLHHRELALFQDRMPLDVQYHEYVVRERRGNLFLTTGRLNDRIVAYYVAQTAPGFHYGSTLCAHMDICYVLPEHRGKGLSRPLWRTVEMELRRRGVGPWYSGWKTPKAMGMDVLHEKFGFSPADTYVVKWLGGRQ
jgi:GNAT superfamily N-acetyltransferase